MTKPGFIKNRIKILFRSDDIDEQKKVLLRYNNKRDKQIEKSCYCGHTIDCDCSNPGMSEFTMAILNDNIDESELS